MNKSSADKVYKLQVNGMVFPVNIYVESRRNSRISIGKRGINIRLPFWMSKKEKDRQILKFMDWARNHVAKNAEKYKNIENKKKYRDGEILKVGENFYNLDIEYQDRSTSTARLKDQTIQMKISNHSPHKIQQEQISKLISRCVAAHNLPDIKARIEELNNRYFGKTIKRVALKNTKSRWGSCSEKGSINISTRILFAPQEVIDYVCIHELAHLIEPNHSKKFWQLVQGVRPDYKKRIKWLKQNGDRCRF